MNIDIIQKTDPDIACLIEREFDRQFNTLEMIASENLASPAVMAVMGSPLTNKYAEGYPGRRYYGGCEHVDDAERLAIARAKEIFGAEYANVQPHSGSQANMAVYFALLSPGDRIMGMDLSHGGHLTHGSPVSFSGRLFNFAHYGVNPETGYIDYDRVAEIAREFKPKLIVAGASAYPRILDFPRFKEIADEVGAYLMVDMAHIAGLVAAGVHPSPVPHANVVTSTTHKTMRGPRGGLILASESFGKELNSQIFPGIQGGPLMNTIAAKALSFKEASTEEFRVYQKQIVENAATLAETLMENGIDLVSGGTDNHLMLADLTNLNVTGKDAQNLLEQAGITTNKNAIPNETRSPFVTSGVRIGTPAITSRGMKSGEMKVIAGYINDVLRHPEDETIRLRVRKGVTELCAAFPVYPELRQRLAAASS